MFASLKSKIKEETGSDLSRLTSSWRNGAFLGRMSLRDDSSTASPSSSGGPGESTSDLDLVSRMIQAKSNFKKSPKERITKEYLEGRLELLEQMWFEFSAGHKELMRTVPDVAKFAETKYVKDSVCNQGEEIYFEYKLLIKSLLSKFVDMQPGTSTNDEYSRSLAPQSQLVNVKLPKSLSPQLESYLSERTGGQIDQSALQQQYSGQLEEKLRERDVFWQQKLDEVKLSLSTAQGEEAAAAQAVARAAQAEAAKAMAERDSSQKQLHDLRDRLAALERAQDRLDALTEELEQARREWAKERSELAASVSEWQGRARDLADELALVRAALPPAHPLHRLHDDDKRSLTPTGCEDYDRVCRERSVLTRQLQEAKMALADVKTSWSGQIASLETQVARLSRQAGEEGAERRRVETEKREMQEKLSNMAAELEKTKQNLINSEAKVVRLNGEVHTLAMEAKALRGAASHAAERSMELQSRIEALTEENRQLTVALESERELVRTLTETVEVTGRRSDEQRAEVNHLNSLVTDMQHDFVDMQRKYDKEKREKDDALMRNAHMSQSIEMSQCDVRYQEVEINELKAKIAELSALIAQHKENQAACMLIKENEEARKAKIEELKRRVDEMTECDAALKKTIQDLETEICDKNKKIKTLDNRISDMKKTLQRELQSSKSDLSTAEEQDISRRYLKHVVLRFLTAHELEARQLTRALSALLRLSAHEEALLRAALPPRTGLAAWLPSLHT